MYTILLLIFIGTAFNFMIWQLLTCIATMKESKYENFLWNGAIASGVIAIVASAVYVIYTIVTHLF